MSSLVNARSEATEKVRSRLSRKLRYVALVCLILGVCDIVLTGIAWARAWGFLEGPGGTSRVGASGFILTLGALGLLLERRWGRIMLTVLLQFPLLVGALVALLGPFEGKFALAGSGLLLGGLALLALRWLWQPGMEAVLVESARHSRA